MSILFEYIQICSHNRCIFSIIQGAQMGGGLSFFKILIVAITQPWSKNFSYLAEGFSPLKLHHAYIPRRVILLVRRGWV